ncbi:MAG: hypothetical protein IJ086_13995 [Clostridium sp.]|nr:hypothetical protein [Clostridium sp.]MBQ9072684.1 hypothetical protein [Bacilli bacterium]
MKKITETVICLKTGGLTLSDVKRIRTTLGKPIYNLYLRAEKLHEQCYILRFKKNTTIEEAQVIIKHIKKIDPRYNSYHRNKTYKQLRENLLTQAKEKQDNYAKKRGAYLIELATELQKAQEKGLERENKLATSEA